MNENSSGTSNLLDTTDCLEAVGVFRGWKNFSFIILVLCILLLQAGFWLLDLGMIPVPEGAAAGNESGEPDSSIIPDANKAGQLIDKPKEAVVPGVNVEPNKPVGAGGATLLAAEMTIPAPNDVSDTEPAKKDFLSGITFGQVVWTMRFVNAVLILTSALYCLTMLFSLKVSMLGRLGGINHITRAFFLSLFMFILVLPWQKVFDGVIFGAIFTPAEFVKWNADKTSDMFDMILYYMRFSGFMALVFILLLLAQLRSGRWAKAILRRLEII